MEQPIIPPSPPPLPGPQASMSSPAVHAQLTIYQGIINRMATGSASCKTWCITIVSAILVVMADKQKGNYIPVALVPIVLFYFLDSYYLHLERCFIGSYNKFLKHVREGTATDDELFRIAPPRGLMTACKGVGRSAFSFSTGPFYLTLATVSIIAALYLVGPTPTPANQPLAQPTNATPAGSPASAPNSRSTSKPAPKPLGG